MKNKNPITICFLGSYDKNYSRNVILFRGLREHGINFTEVHAPLKIMELNGRKHISLMPIFHRIFRKLLLFPIVIKNLHKIYKTDVIFVAYPAHLDVPTAWIISKMFGKPLVVDPLFSLSDVFVNDFGIAHKKSVFIRLLSFYEGWIYKRAAKIIIDTPFQKEMFIKQFNISPDKIAVVPLGADNNRYIRKAAQNPSGIFTVVYYGLYNPVHGVEYIVNAAKKLQKYKDIKFLFIGEGQTFPETFERVKKEKITNITFLKLKEKEALPYLYQADVFLGLFGNSQSVFRTVANKVLQGLAMGKAVISSKGPAVESFFTSYKQLILIPPEDGDALSKAILYLKNNPQKRKSIQNEGYNFFMSHFTPYQIAKSLIHELKGIS